MPTWTALTHVIGREAAANLADLCEDLLPEPVGTGIFEIEDGSDSWEVGAYFTDPPDEIALAHIAEGTHFLQRYEGGRWEWSSRLAAAC